MKINSGLYYAVAVSWKILFIATDLDCNKAYLKKYRTDIKNILVTVIALVPNRTNKFDENFLVLLLLIW